MDSTLVTTPKGKLSAFLFSFGIALNNQKLAGIRSFFQFQTRIMAKGKAKPFWTGIRMPNFYKEYWDLGKEPY